MRGPRRESESGVYHAMGRGVGKQIIFEDDEDRLEFLKLLRSAAEAEGVDILAWCLMENHFHVLVKSSPAGLSSCMKRLCGFYARYFNKRHGRSGHVFEGRFASEPVDDDAYLMTVVRYIHQNPEKAGVSRVENYLWSSYQEYVGAEKLCRTEWVLGVFGGREAFMSFHQVKDARMEVLDIDFKTSGPARENDELVIKANATVAPYSIGTLKGMEKDVRNAALCKLKEAGFTVRQIERLTGIGRNIIQRAK